MFIAFCSFLLFFGLGIRFINRAHIKSMESKCELHRWEIFNNQMICLWCKKTPEEVRR